MPLSTICAGTGALPRRTEHQRTELGVAKAGPHRTVDSWPDEVALLQPTSRQPDSDAVMHQHLHPVTRRLANK